MDTMANKLGGSREHTPVASKVPVYTCSSCPQCPSAAMTTPLAVGDLQKNMTMVVMKP